MTVFALVLEGGYLYLEDEETRERLFLGAAAETRSDPEEVVYLQWSEDGVVVLSNEKGMSIIIPIETRIVCPFPIPVGGECLSYYLKPEQKGKVHVRELLLKKAS